MSDDFSDAVATLEAYISSIGDSIKDYKEIDLTDILEEDGEGILDDSEDEIPDKFVIFICSRDNSIYYIVCFPERDYFNILYPFDFIGSLASDIDTESGREFLTDRDDIPLPDHNPDNFTEDERVRRKVAVELLVEFGQDSNDKLRYQLIDRVLRSDVSIDISTFSPRNNVEIVTDFNINTRIFPYESTFQRSRLYDRVSSVVNAGDRTSEYLKYSFDLPTVVQETDIDTTKVIDPAQ